MIEYIKYRFKLAKFRPRQVAIKLGRNFGHFFQNSLVYHKGALPTEKIKILPFNKRGLRLFSVLQNSFCANR